MQPLFTIKNTIAVLFRSKDYDLKSPEFVDKLESMLSDNRIFAGFSTPFTGIGYLNRYFVQCRYASEKAVNQAVQTYISYEACQSNHIIETLTKENALRSYCHPKIYELWEEDDESKRELIHCMYKYLQNGRNVTATAQHLYLHRNTLLYRINKMAKLLEIDFNKLTDEEIRFLTLSCMFVENT